MSGKNLSISEIERLILYKLARRGAWGEAYAPLDTITRQLSKKVKHNGKRVKRAISSLIRRSYIIPHKEGKTISLNPSRKREIITEIDKLLTT